MTYLQFHLIFIFPPLLLLVLTSGNVLRRIGPRAIPSLAGVVLVALIYTTPWDSELIRRGVWGYGPERVIGTIGLIPIEEYMFFILQPLLTGLWFYRMIGPRDADAPPAPPAVRWGPAVGYALLAAWGWVLLQREEGTYLGMILAWAAPVLAAQWGVAGGRIGAARRTFLLAVGIPTLYLWMADAIAIRLGIWHISETLTLGIKFGPLPLEEATFFLATNLLVVQGLTLFLHPFHKPVAHTAAAPASR
ncbi:lycopene cyclase domain-containing protein [Longimicrobium sp.]|uniref:lycopene cyclase domain-containing protein n=1 Tax=Longimicrobium sp. TaxID=2029185 RepID=UPI003B3A9A28